MDTNTFAPLKDEWNEEKIQLIFLRTTKLFRTQIISTHARIFRAQLKLEQIKSYSCVIKKKVFEFFQMMKLPLATYAAYSLLLLLSYSFFLLLSASWIWKSSNATGRSFHLHQKRRKRWEITWLFRVFSAYVINLYFSNRLFIFRSHKNACFFFSPHIFS